MDPYVAATVPQVLEVSAGTGRNFSSYSTDVEHVVFSDVSFEMLRLAKLKWEACQPRYAASFMISDVDHLVCTPFHLPPVGFDLQLIHLLIRWL